MIPLLSRRRFFLTAAAAFPFGNSGNGGTEAEIRAIEEMFVAPCCYRQQISIHDSREAASMRSEVRSMVMAGKTREQIRAVFVNKYGTRILAAPPATGFFLLAYLLPPFALGCGALAAGFFVQRALSRKGSVVTEYPAQDPQTLNQYQSRIEQDIQTFVPLD